MIRTLVIHIFILSIQDKLPNKTEKSINFNIIKLKRKTIYRLMIIYCIKQIFRRK